MVMPQTWLSWLGHVDLPSLEQTLLHCVNRYLPERSWGRGWAQSKQTMQWRERRARVRFVPLVSAWSKTGLAKSFDFS